MCEREGESETVERQRQTEYKANKGVCLCGNGPLCESMEDDIIYGNDKNAHAESSCLPKRFIQRAPFFWANFCASNSSFEGEKAGEWQKHAS